LLNSPFDTIFDAVVNDNPDTAGKREIDIPDTGQGRFTSDNGGLGISLTYDNRDSIFTPNRGLNAKLRFNYYDQAFGGDFRYNLLEGFCIGYLPLHPRLVPALRLEGTFSGGDVPFYALPFLDMRGVPLMKYQGEDAALVVPGPQGPSNAFDEGKFDHFNGEVDRRSIGVIMNKTLNLYV